MPNLKVLSNLFRRYAHDSTLLAGEIDNIEADASSFTTQDTVMKTSRKAYADLDHDDAERNPRDADQWTRKDHGTKTPGIQTGPQQRMSGSGADDMVQTYGEPASQGELTRALAALSSQLCDNSKRLDATEKALSALARFIAKDSNAKFPDNAEAADGDENDDEDRDDEDGDDNEAAEKAMRTGRLPTTSIPNFLNRLMSQSRHLATPPDFAKGGRGAPSLNDLLMTADLTPEESIRLKTFAKRLAAHRAGLLPINMVGSLPEASERVFMKSREAAALLRN